MAQTATTEHSAASRLVGLDLVRFASFIAAAIFHFANVVWYSRDVPGVVSSTELTDFMRLVTENYARALSFSGFTIVGLACFLQGITNSALRTRTFLFSFLVLAWLVFCLLIATVTNFYPAWDVYPLIFGGLLVMVMAERFGKWAVRGVGLLGFGMMFVEFWHWQFLHELPLFWEQIVVGNCQEDLHDWPILPWLGLPWWTFAFGYELRLQKEAKGRLPTPKLGWGEAAIWGVALLASLPAWGEYYVVPLGRHFACYVYTRPPLVFWSHLIWPIFLVRLAFVPWVQTILSGNRFTAWVSGLAMSRHFWLAYIIHYVLAYWVKHFLVFLDAFFDWQHIYIVAVCYAAFLPVTELLTRALLYVGRNWAAKSGLAGRGRIQADSDEEAK